MATLGCRRKNYLDFNSAVNLTVLSKMNIRCLNDSSEAPNGLDVLLQCASDGTTYVYLNTISISNHIQLE